MKIGVFDSGYGGLTILDSILKRLPQYEYIYLGDNARAPYGTRSFDVIYQYTLQAVRYLFENDCVLVILACNTASSKALRTIQQHDLTDLTRRVLGVIRPTVEIVPQLTHSGHIGVLATQGTVTSDSYVMELHKIDPSLIVNQQACPMWVPLIEANEHQTEGADYFVRKYIFELLEQDPLIDTIILGCTHYPLLEEEIHRYLDGRNIKIVCQGDIVASSLQDYLQRHSEIRSRLTLAPSHAGTECRFLTTESAEKFNESASLFLSSTITAEHIILR